MTSHILAPVRAGPPPHGTALCAPPQRPEAKIEAEEADADKQPHDHAGLLGASADHQNPSRE
eukprot:7381880-Prymnesium_polylepis.2